MAPPPADPGVWLVMVCSPSLVLPVCIHHADVSHLSMMRCRLSGKEGGGKNEQEEELYREMGATTPRAKREKEASLSN